MDDRVTRSRKKTIETFPTPGLPDELIGKPGCNEMEYNGSVIIAEVGGRVVVAKNGLHQTEFIARCDDDIILAIEHAKEYIDNAIR